MSLIYVGQNRTTSPFVTTRKLYDSGTSIWTRDHGDAVAAVAVDSDGNVYTAGRSATSGYYNAIRKYTSSGTAVTDGWPVNIGNANQATSITVDSSGAVYVGSLWANSGSRGVQKYASTGGSVVWQYNFGNDVYGLAIAGDGNLIAVGARISNITIRKLNASSGSSIWAADHGSTTRAVAVDDSGNIYTGGDSSSGFTTRKWDQDGTEITADNWPLDGGNAVYALAVADGLVVTGGLQTSGITTRAYDAADGSALWTANHGEIVQAVAMDESGAVYTGGPVSSSVNIRKYLADGTAVTTVWPITTSAAVNALCTGPAPELFSLPPGLPLQWEMAVPQISIGQPVPGLPILSMAFGVPMVTADPMPPDWSSSPAQSIYRCYLTGGETLLELPIAVFQCRRRAGESTWLTVDIPYYSQALTADIAARSLGQLVLYAGIRDADGNETMGEMLRAWLTETEITREDGRALIHLTGRIVPTPFSMQTRALRGIETRGKTNGRWQVRCAVDTLLRPNDTILDGETSFVAGAIMYTISPHTSYMTVTEK